MNLEDHYTIDYTKSWPCVHCHSTRTKVVSKTRRVFACLACHKTFQIVRTNPRLKESD